MLVLMCHWQMRAQISRQMPLLALPTFTIISKVTIVSVRFVAANDFSETLALYFQRFEAGCPTI